MSRTDWLILLLILANGGANALAPDLSPGWLHNLLVFIAGGSLSAVAFLRGLGQKSKAPEA